MGGLGGLRRLSLLLAVAFAVLLGLPGAASAASVKVVDTDGSSSVVDLDALQGSEDVDGVGYAMRSSSGTTTQNVTGFSLDFVIDQSDADRISYTYANIARPGGGSVQLTNGQIRQAGAFPDGPPAVYADGDDVGFVRPSTGGGDLNAPDSFKAPSQLVVKLQTGTPIEIEATANESKIEVGDEVSFFAVVSAPAGLVPTVRWSFDDGAGAQGENANHVFKKPGSYDVVATATTPEDRTGSSDVITIQVGEPKDKGPDRRGGGKDKDDDAPDSGSSTGTGGQEGGTGTGTGPGTYPTAPVAPGAVPPITPEQPQDEGRDKPDRETASGEEVTGEVLQDAGALTPAEEPDPTKKEPAPPTARTGTEQSDGAGIPGAALGGMAVLALFGVGALGQAGKIRLDSMLWHANRLVGR